MKGRTPEEKFAARISPCPITGCWWWTGDKGPHGYGLLYLGGAFGRRRVFAHRFSYALHRGELPDGMCVLHRCDRPQCVNPAHLFAGTKRDNAVDMYAKGRGAKHVRCRGEDQPNAKLTESAVSELRRTYVPRSPAFGDAAQARRLGVSTTAVRLARLGLSWRTVGR